MTYHLLPILRRSVALIIITMASSIWAGDIVVDSTAQAVAREVGSQGMTDRLVVPEFTVADKPDRLLVVVVGGEISRGAVKSVRFGEHDLKLAVAVRDMTNNKQFTEIWYLLDPPAATAPVSVTLASPGEWAFGVASLRGVANVEPVSTGHSEGTTDTHTLKLVTGKAGLFSVEAIASNNHKPKPENEQKIFFSEHNDQFTVTGAIGRKLKREEAEQGWSVEEPDRQAVAGVIFTAAGN